MNLAIIPARGGSKRIPRKNIKDFCGKPIIAYSIETAIKSGLFDKVIVSTDDEEIAEVARNYGAETPFMRPKELADDYSTTTDVIQHAISRFIDAGLKINNVCCIYATAPLIKPSSLIQGYQNLHIKDCNMSFSAARYNSPIQRAFRIQNDQKIIPVTPEFMLKRSQDLEESYHDVGQFYWAKSEFFNCNYSFFSDNCIPVILSSNEVQDIDTLEDWELAQLKYRLQNNK